MSSRLPISRRKLLIGGGAGVGLVVAWALWPRSYRHNLVAGEGESVFNAFLKIGEDGHVAVIVPQAEMGQGVWTTLPQALADELGADWRTIGVETAPINPLYANELYFAQAWGDVLPEFLGGAGEWSAREFAVRNALMITAGSTSARGFETRFREAGAAARALLCQEAASRWDVDWSECTASNGLVAHGEQRLRFGELAAGAAAREAPGEIGLRAPGAGGISGRAMPRLDLPAKVDGSARYAADVRLPGMVFASAAQRPSPAHSLRRVDRAAADRVLGVMAVFENPDFVACAATNWWAANRGVEALAPVWDGPALDDGATGAALEAALDAVEGVRFHSVGDLAAAFAGGGALVADYAVAPAAHAALEPLTATARLSGDRLEIWAPTQAPGLMRAAVARATGRGESQITIYPMLVGGGFGRKIESDAAVQAAIVATRMNRPVQLSWSREEDLARDRMRPPARARMYGKLAPDGTILALQTQIAVPSVYAGLRRRLMPGLIFGDGTDEANASAIAGALPAYAIPHLAIEHLPVETGHEYGLWRSDAHSYTAFFTESFVDELARETPLEPLSFRIAMLGQQARLARCLATVAAMAGWDGGVQAGGMGIAAHSAFGSHAAIVAQVHVDESQRAVVDKVSAVVDCGRVINPEIVRQQIEGGIIFAIGAALGGAPGFDQGRARIANYDRLGLPTLATSPEIAVQIIESDEAPGGVGELAVPPTAPAIGNAIYAATGRRLRRLPFVIGGVA